MLDPLEPVIDNPDVCLIKECWVDEFHTLQQYISFLNNKSDKYSARDMLNPNLTILERTVYLNKDLEEIDIEK